MSDQALDIDPKQTALIMVDMQNDFCHPEGFYARNRDRMTSIGLVPELVEGRVGTMKDLLRAARSMEDLWPQRALDLHPLRGDRAGQHALRITGRVRLIVTFSDTGARIEEVVDYHG